MKIGVVTTQYASNYGALLQTYALQKYINNGLKQNSEVLSYYPSHYEEYWKSMPPLDGLKNALLFAFCCVTPWRVLGTKRRFKKMKTFVENKIPCSKPYYSIEEIEAEECSYDVIICGSDQIWNVSRHDNLQDVWFLGMKGNGWENARRIAYAPSIADPIPDRMKDEISIKLKDFYAVSVRESGDVEQVENLYSGKVQHVCDPVFLLSTGEWREIAKKPNISEPYILCYFLNPGAEAAELVGRIKKLTGLKVLQIDINQFNKITTDIDVLDASPEEFVGLFDNAEYVITNSFHGTAFSILFQKDFLVLKKQSANSRMESLLEMVGLSSRFVYPTDINNFGKENLTIDYSVPGEKLHSFISTSKKYLIDALEEKKW